MTDYDYTADIAWDYVRGQHVIHVRYRRHKNAHYGKYRRLTIIPEKDELFEDACVSVRSAIEAQDEQAQ